MRRGRPSGAFSKRNHEALRPLTLTEPLTLPGGKGVRICLPPAPRFCQLFAPVMPRQRTLFGHAEDTIQTSSQKTGELGTLSGDLGDGACPDRKRSDGERSSPDEEASALGPSKARDLAQETLPSIPELSQFPHAKGIETPEEVKAAGGTVKKTEGRGTHAGTTYNRYKIEGPIVLNEQIQKSVSAGPLPVGEAPEWEEGVGLSDEGGIRRDMLRTQERVAEGTAGVIANADRMHLAYLRRTSHDPSAKARPRIWLTFHEIAEWAHEKETSSKGEGPQIFLYAIAQHILDAFDIPEDTSSWPKAIARRLREGTLDLRQKG